MRKITIEVPFMVGDIVYRVNPCQDYIIEEVVEEVGFDKEGIFIETDSSKYREYHINKLVFASYDDAYKQKSGDSNEK
jgi:hypothetical protein